jgi:polysaccharide biosynthesis protein PslC
MEGFPRISVIIPTRNGEKTLFQLLSQLALQSVKADELLIVDSSSNDQTVVIAKEFGAIVSVIPLEEFDHGTTRSMMAAQAKGEILLFFTQDAVPASLDVIEKLIAPFKKDASIGVSYGRQLPNQDASLFAAALRAFNYPANSMIREFSHRSKLGLKTVFVSNSCAAYRKSCLHKIDYFRGGLIFGEDTCAAGRLLEKGYKISYAAEAAVYHSHNYSLIQEFRRSFDIGVLHSSESWLLKTYGRAEGEGIRYVKFELFKILEQKKLYLLPVFFFRNLAKYSGYKLGSMYENLPQGLIPRLSMNSAWWHRTDK